MRALHIDGDQLALEDLREVVFERRPVLLTPDAREKVLASREVIEQLVRENRVAYAVTTGVGKLSDVRIAPEQICELQLNLLRSHAVGIGTPLSEPVTRAMMLLRANSLAKGFSGVRPLVIDTLCEMLSRGVHPIIPSQGSVGASGDLAPLAHLALVLVGEGEALFQGRKVAGREAMAAAQVKPIALEAKEAISLINGTQAMLAVGTLSVLTAQTLVDIRQDVGGRLRSGRLSDGFPSPVFRVECNSGQIGVFSGVDGEIIPRSGMRFGPDRDVCGSGRCSSDGRRYQCRSRALHSGQRGPA